MIVSGPSLDRRFLAAGRRLDSALGVIFVLVQHALGLFQSMVNLRDTRDHWDGIPSKLRQQGSLVMV